MTRVRRGARLTIAASLAIAGFAANPTLALSPEAVAGAVAQRFGVTVLRVLPIERDGKPLPVTKAAKSESAAASSIVQPPSAQPEGRPQETPGVSQSAPSPAPAATETREGPSESPRGPLPTTSSDAPDEPSLRSRLYGSEESGPGNEPPGEPRP